MTRTLPKSTLVPTFLLRPLCQAFCNEVKAITPTPYEPVVAGGLVAMSVACHGFIDVERPGCSQSSITLAVMAIGKSGERKSAIDCMNLAVVRAHERHEEEVRERKDDIAFAKNCWGVSDAHSS